MNTTQNFFVKVTDLQASGGASEDTQDMQITANVEEKISQPSYMVTVPDSVAMGTLSTEKNNVYTYAVDVEASDLNGKLSISAPEKGSLASGENTLDFTNSFGTQTVSEDTAGSKLSGSIGIAAADVSRPPQRATTQEPPRSPSLTRQTKLLLPVRNQYRKTWQRSSGFCP